MAKDIILDHFDHPTDGFVRVANQIGYQAWLDRFNHRGEEAVKHHFDPDQPEKLRQKMRKAVRSGHFVGTIVSVGSVGEPAAPVGMAWGSDDMPGRLLARTAKHLKGEQPNAAVAQINVLPSQQGKGYGTALLDGYLANFRDIQQPVAYVFDENQLAVRWFRERFGFRPVPATTQLAYEQFGSDQVAVRQWRLEAMSVAAVHDRIVSL